MEQSRGWKQLKTKRSINKHPSHSNTCFTGTFLFFSTIDSTSTIGDLSPSSLFFAQRSFAMSFIIADLNHFPCWWDRLIHPGTLRLSLILLSTLFRANCVNSAEPYRFRCVAPASKYNHSFRTRAVTAMIIIYATTVLL